MHFHIDMMTHGIAFVESIDATSWRKSVTHYLVTTIPCPIQLNGHEGIKTVLAALKLTLKPPSPKQNICR